MTWHENAQCRAEQARLDLFFPISTPLGTYVGPAAQQAEQAKEICHRCPVQEQCLLAALQHRIDEGIWAGMTPAERRTLRRHQITRRATTSRPAA